MNYGRTEYGEAFTKPVDFSMLLRPRFLMETLLNFGCGWLFSREVLRILPAAPSLLAGAAILSALLQHYHTEPARRLRKYQKQLDAAAAQRDPHTQRVLINALIQAQPGEPQHRYRLALLQAECGASDAALAGMSALAGQDSGYAPAHLWLAEHALQNEASGDLPSGDTNAAVKHLRAVLRHRPRHHRANELLAEIYIRQEQASLAVPHLKQAAMQEPKHRLLLARIQRSQGDQEQSSQNAGLAEAALRDAAAEHPDRPDFRLGWSESLLLQGKSLEAESVLREGLAKIDATSLRAALSSLLVDAVANELSFGLAAPNRHLRRLEESIELNPLNLRALELLTRLEGVPLDEADRLMATVRHRVHSALEEKPGDVPLLMLASKAASLAGDIDEAIEHLAQAADRDPSTQLTLTEALFRWGRDDAARNAGLAAANYFADLSRKEPSNLKARLNWARCEVLLERWASARSILMEGLYRSDEPRVRRALSEMYCAAARKLQNDNRIGQSVTMLRLAAESDPTHRDALAMLAELHRGDQAAEEAGDVLRDLLRDGKSMFQIHSLLGANAAFRDQFNVAVRHLEQALQFRPRDPVAANNLAHALANQPGADMDRALRLAEQALAALPGHYEVLETRGEVLMRKGRWHEAIRDLSLALNESPHTQRIHERLAEAYQRLGDADMADRHRQIAAQ